MKAKYEKLADELREVVLRNEPGQKLASIREIGKKKGVSHFTVQRAMGLLEEEGFVKRRRSMGMYCARPGVAGTHHGKEAKRRILLLVPNNWHDEMLTIIDRTLVEHGFLTLLRHYDLNGSPARWIPRVRFDGVVFIGWCSPEMVPALRKKNTPFVAQGLQYYHPDIDNTCGDERLAGTLAARHLIQRGHQKIAVLLHEPHSPDIIERVRGFTNEARLQNIEAEVLDCKMVWGDNARLRAKQVIEERIAQGPVTFTGLFSVGDTGAASVLQACYEHGIRVPEQLSVIGLGDLPESAYLCPSLTTLAFDPRDRAEAIAEILERRFDGDDSQRIQKMFDPVLIERNSTARPVKE